jgi:hypothetical protein
MAVKQVHLGLTGYSWAYGERSGNIYLQRWLLFRQVQAYPSHPSTSRQKAPVACDYLDQRFSTFLNSRHTLQGPNIVGVHYQFLQGEIIKIVFKSSIANIPITVLFLKIMLIMDFERVIIKFYVHICYYSKHCNAISLKTLLFINKSYDIFHWHQKSVPSTSLLLNEIMKNQVLNKIVHSMMKNFNTTLLSSIYNKYQEGKNFSKYKHE